MPQRLLCRETDVAMMAVADAAPGECHRSSKGRFD